LRRLIVASAIVAVLAIAVLWKLRAPASGPAAPAPTARVATPAMPSAPSATSPAIPSPPSIASAGDDGEARPQPVPLPAGQAPPPDDAPHSKPAPPQTAFTRDETIAKREADLKLLDDTKTRLDGELATAKSAGDSTETHDLQVRIDRLVALRKKRSAELEQIRAGGAIAP
jgi:hypothetical protein